MDDSGKLATRGRFSGQATHAFETLRSWILDGTLPPGAHVSVRETAAKLKTSNGPVRDALIALRSHRLVEGGHGPDWHVAGVSREMIEDSLVVREALETQSARMAALAATPMEIRRLRVLATELDDRAERGAGDEELTWELDTRFHRAVAQISGSPRLCEEIDRWKVVMVWACAYVRQRKQPNRRGQSHVKLVDAIATGDPRIAADEMRDHVRHPWQDLARTTDETATPTSKGAADRSSNL